MMGYLLLSSGMAYYISEKCTECSGQGLLGCVRDGIYFFLYERFKNVVGKDGVVVFQMVSVCVFLVNVKPLNVPLFSGDVTPA